MKTARHAWLLFRALYEIARYEVILFIAGFRAHSVAVEAAIHCAEIDH